MQSPSWNHPRHRTLRKCPEAFSVANVAVLNHLPSTNADSLLSRCLDDKSSAALAWTLAVISELHLFIDEESVLIGIYIV